MENGRTKVDHSDNGSMADGEWMCVDTSGRKDTVIMTCPECGTPTVLRDHRGGGHTIGVYGKVEPSVGCANVECGWVDYVRLCDWRDLQCQTAS